VRRVTRVHGNTRASHIARVKGAMGENAAEGTAAPSPSPSPSPSPRTRGLDEDKTVIIRDVCVGEKRRRTTTPPGEGEGERDATAREVREKIEPSASAPASTSPGARVDAKEDDGGREDDERTTTTTTTTTIDTDKNKDASAAPVVFGGAAPTGGFGSALAGSGFSGFGGLKAASAGGGFGGFAATASKASTTSGFASAPSAPVFGGAKAPVALFGAGKKADGDEEEGEDDPEAELANDSIKPVVELEVVETKTGEEDETCAFRAEGALFEYVVDAEKGAQWVERGRGDLRLNEGESGSRLVMRAKGNYRLMLNAALFKGQKFKLMEGGKGVSFTCKNAVNGPDAKMTTFALKMRAAASNAQSQADGFQAAATKAIAKLEDK